jgi:hypothetical protein
MTLRVILAEDGLLDREGVTCVLDESDDIEIVATCADATTLRPRSRGAFGERLAQSKQHRPIT